MRKIYSSDILVAMTAYVVAESEDEAREKLKSISNTGLQFTDRVQHCGDGVCMTGASFERMLDEGDARHEAFDGVCLSPACTVLELDKDFAVEVADD